MWDRINKLKVTKLQIFYLLYTSKLHNTQSSKLASKLAGAPTEQLTVGDY